MGHTGSFVNTKHGYIKSQLPNAPAFTSEERYALAMLALGSIKCNRPTFFFGLKENVSIASKSEDIQNIDKDVQILENTSNDIRYIESSNDLQNNIECPINEESFMQIETLFIIFL
ncbi:unnamed protein product [Macrosiphum euphorbiae]|uniref:Uncharacterized protein n=1 Tax=Macrosiphum euphorbiae TaxID=13131 RepID=A0AAV0WJ52_9HEMI|nr:unnamed protein product [Macrosiphum euphorbiae]